MLHMNDIPLETWCSKLPFEKNIILGVGSYSAVSSLLMIKFRLEVTRISSFQDVSSVCYEILLGYFQYQPDLVLTPSLRRIYYLKMFIIYCMVCGNTFWMDFYKTDKEILFIKQTKIRTICKMNLINNLRISPFL